MELTRRMTTVIIISFVLNIVMFLKISSMQDELRTVNNNYGQW